MGKEYSSEPMPPPPAFASDVLWLAACPGLAVIRDAAWLKAAGAAQQHAMGAGRRMFPDHALNRSLLIVLKGRIQVYKSGQNREVALYRLKTGDVCLFNVVSQLFGNPFYRVTAITETEVEFVSIPPEHFECAFLNSPEFRHYIVASVVQRLTDMMQLLEGIVFQRLDARLVQLLLSRPRDSEGCVFVTHSDIARELGSSREVVSRLLKEFEHKGWLSLARGEIHVQNLDELRDFQQSRLLSTDQSK